MNVRSVTCKLLEMADEGLLTYKQIAEAALNFMSEDEVADMAHCNELLDDTSSHDCDDDEHDQFNSDAEADADVLASAGMGTDEDYGGCDERY